MKLAFASWHGQHPGTGSILALLLAVFGAVFMDERLSIGNSRGVALIAGGAIRVAAEWQPIRTCH
jgi:hypothetical protein